jgi:hypothetical protein
MGKWIKPTLDTKFHIDFDWWREKGLNFRLALRDQLCDICRERYDENWDVEEVDWVDPDTAIVTRTDPMMQCMLLHCKDRDDFIGPHVPLTTNVFRVFLVNGNKPLSPVELGEIITWRTPETILRVIKGPRVYLGIKPVQPDEQ